MRADHRRWPRRAFAGGWLPPSARIRPGLPVTVVDLSVSGTLVESGQRMRPGSRCEFQLTGAAGDVIVSARVVRCFVARLGPSSVRYRSALVFDDLIVLPAEQELLAGYRLPAGSAAPAVAGVATSPRDRAAGRSGAAGPGVPRLRRT